MKANNETAKVFQGTVADKILPSIRKQGVYMTAQAAEQILLNPDFIIKLAEQVKTARKERDEYKALAAAKDETIKALEPKAAYTEAVLLSDELLTSELIAKEYGQSARWLHATLEKFGVMFQRGRRWYLKRPFDKKEYRRTKTETLARGKTVTSHYWTQSGRHFVYNFLKARAVLPLREVQDPMPDLFGGAL